MFTAVSVGRALPDGYSFANGIFNVIECRYIPAVFPTRPMHRINVTFDPFVKAGIQPFAGAANKAVFDRVVMDVVEVAFEVVLIFDGVFPESWLPNRLWRGLRTTPPSDRRHLRSRGDGSVWRPAIARSGQRMWLGLEPCHSVREAGQRRRNRVHPLNGIRFNWRPRFWQRLLS